MLTSHQRTSRIVLPYARGCAASDEAIGKHVVPLLRARSLRDVERGVAAASCSSDWQPDRRALNVQTDVTNTFDKIQRQLGCGSRELSVAGTGTAIGKSSRARAQALDTPIAHKRDRSGPSRTFRPCCDLEGMFGNARGLGRVRGFAVGTVAQHCANVFSDRTPPANGIETCTERQRVGRVANLKCCKAAHSLP